jgi:hypothetical protein
MIDSIACARTEFSVHGLTRLGGFIPPRDAIALGLDAYRTIIEKGRARTTAAETGALDIPRNAMRFASVAEWPVLSGLYAGVRAMASLVANAELSLSPYGPMGSVVRLMDQPGDRDDWHYDSNPISAVLYLSSHPESVGDGQLDWMQSDGGGHYTIWPEPGDLIVFMGRKILHRVPPLLAKGTTRVACVFNLYPPGDLWRPFSLDGYLWGEK